MYSQPNKAIVGKNTFKSNEDLNRNEEFLRKKRKQNGNTKHRNEDSINNGYKVNFPKREEIEEVINLIDDEEEIIIKNEKKIKKRQENLINSEDNSNLKISNVRIMKTNIQLEEDDILFTNNQKIDITSDSDNSNRQKKKIKKDLGIEDEDEVIKEEDKNLEIKVKTSKSSESDRKKKKRRREEDKLTKYEKYEKQIKSSNDNNKDNNNFISPFHSQADFISIPNIASTETVNTPNTSSKSNLLMKSPNPYLNEDFYPWLTEKSRQHRGPIKLHYEILEFYDFIKPTTEEDLLREKTYRLLKDLIQEKLPNLKVKKFGSFPTKIHLPDSDVDIVVLSEDSSQDQMKILKKITNLLLERDMVDYIKIIEARVPIIRATMKETKINMDISANRKNGYEAKNVIKKVLDDYPCMRPLIYVLKYFLRLRKLNESYTGGISSFLLFNLLFSYVQYISKKEDFTGKTLGHILTGFLQFYSFDFNFEEVGISIRHGGYFYKKSDADNKRNSLLSVENFQELDQDVGKSSFKFRKVLDCFKMARDCLYYPSQYPIVSYLGMFIKVDSFISERYKILNMFNDKLE